MTTPTKHSESNPTGQTTAVTSVALGAASGIAWLLPILGAPIAIASLVFGGMGLKTDRHRLAITGMVLGGIGLLLSIGNAIVGAYLLMNGGGAAPPPTY